MTQVLLIGDLHLSDKPPSNCTDSYNDDLFTMLEEVIVVSRDRAVDAVVFSGDIFHSKIPMRTSHRTVQRMIRVIQRFPCPVYLVVGNHDIQSDRVESIAETQPFGVLLHSGARLLDGLAGDGLPLVGVSWQQDWQNAGTAFATWRETVESGVFQTSMLLVTHAPLYPPGQELPWENVPSWVVAEWMGSRGFCYYGHVHPLHGVFESNGVIFCNQGALSRGSLHEEDLTRVPAVTIWHSGISGPDAFERIELESAPPADQVFRLAEHTAKVSYRDRLDVFLQQVASSKVGITSVESVIAEVRSVVGLSGDEIALAEEVLNSAIAGEIK